MPPSLKFLESFQIVPAVHELLKALDVIPKKIKNSYQLAYFNMARKSKYQTNDIQIEWWLYALLIRCK